MSNPLLIFLPREKQVFKWDKTLKWKPAGPVVDYLDLSAAIQGKPGSVGPIESTEVEDEQIEEEELSQDHLEVVSVQTIECAPDPKHHFDIIDRTEEFEDDFLANLEREIQSKTKKKRSIQQSTATQRPTKKIKTQTQPTKKMKDTSLSGRIKRLAGNPG
ncbi:hypothetical protein PROFUN_01333 [Planoprotostelium fungivorum]|uniref:Uncharacterized protein n=1 Tax=Planoprotostelium fungivorum TaxID=1890364 RepID=A0A2P6NZU1_9EUKA|nr:hypothetical protein PROFUN_01333 [Planoprotostelium fungivorum]